MNDFLKAHVLAPLVAFLTLAFTFEYFQWDLPIGDFIYEMEGGNGNKFPLEHNFFTEAVMHTGGKYFSMLIGVIFIILLIKCFTEKKYYSLRVPVIFVTLATVLPLVTISLLKSWTHVDCPWDLSRYGGDNPYIPIFEPHPGTFEVNRGFPASHSASGFMWISLYFFFMAVNPKYRHKGLAFGLILGVLYGIGQQLRGAHFLSHDIWSLAICWFFSVLLYYLFLSKRVSYASEQTT